MINVGINFCMINEFICMINEFICIDYYIDQLMIYT